MMSELYKNILIATDGSEYTKKAIKYGVEIAKLSESKIYAIYVVDTTAFASISMDAALENMYELLHQEGDAATKYIEELAIDAGVAVERFILDGNPAEEIVNFANNNSIDLIVMGTMGKSGLDRFLLGSVAEKVTRTSSIPVMVVQS
ncbi:MAG: universal stress protein [Methanosarcinales archaeon]